jgi:hypothetical protein
VDQRHVGVLQRRPPDLEVRDGLAVLLEQVVDVLRRFGRRVDEALVSHRPADLGLTGDLPGQRVGRAVGDDPAAVEDEDPVGQLLGLVQVVRGEQDRGVELVGEAVHQVVELAPGLRVEARGRLVEEQQLRTADDADRDVEPPPLAAGKGPDLLLRVLGEPDGLDQLVGVPRPPHRRCRVGRVVPAEVREQLADAPLPVVAPGLEHDPQPRPPVFTTVCRVDPQHVHLAGRPHAEAFEDLDRGRLARAVRPEQAHDFASVGLEVDSVEHVVRAVPHAQPAHADHGRRWISHRLTPI